MPTIAVCNGTARCSRYIIDIALERGYNVKALVRSTSRFYAKTNKHERLSVHEWPDLNNVQSLQEILHGVSTFYVALGPPSNEPTTMNKDCVQSACAALRPSLSKDGRSSTKIVILAAYPVNPNFNFEGSIAHRISHQLLDNQYGDLEEALKYLRKQQSWLDYVALCPGGIVDVDEEADTKLEVRLVEEEQEPGFISYSRLSSAMFDAGEAEGDKYNHKYLVPIPTTKVKVSFKDFESARSVVSYFFRTRIFPVVFRNTVFALAFAGLGYYARMREQGAWIAANLGVDLK